MPAAISNDRQNVAGRGRRACRGKAASGLRPPASGARLFLARWIRLPRRHMGSRRCVRPDRRRHPRGLRSAVEAHEPCEEMGAKLLKHRQGGFVGNGGLYVHAARHSVRVLTDGSGETASTPKIVSDVAHGMICGSTTKTMRPPAGRPHRES